MTAAPVAGEWVTTPAVRRNVGTFIGIAGPTGSGKTWSALELATGLAGGERFALIDTEHERALMYSEDFAFDHCPFNPPFSSERYGAVIDHHLRLGYKVVVLDSASHEYMGEGGMHDEHDRILDEMVARSSRSGPDWKIREALNWPAWREPKRNHKRLFKAKLTRLPPGHHVILCFRAEKKTEMATVTENGRERKEVRQKEGPTGRDGWFPICDEALPYEMTLSFLVLPNAPGMPLPIKPVPHRLKPFFPLDRPLNRESGRKLAEWARGGSSGSGDTQSIAQPSSPKRALAAADSGSSATEPDDPRERAKVIASIKALAMKVPAADRENAKKTYGIADPQAATLSSLREYESWLRTRAGEAA